MNLKRLKQTRSKKTNTVNSNTDKHFSNHDNPVWIHHHMWVFIAHFTLLVYICLTLTKTLNISTVRSFVDIHCKVCIQSCEKLVLCHFLGKYFFFLFLRNYNLKNSCRVRACVHVCMRACVCMYVCLGVSRVCACVLVYVCARMMSNTYFLLYA